MIVEALTAYLESLSAFWVGLASSGILKTVLIWCLIYWIFCKRGCRRRRHRWARSHGGRHGCCPGCSPCECDRGGCACGGCACGADDHGHDQADHASDPDERAAKE